MRSLKSYYLFWRALYRDKRTPITAKLLILWLPLLYGISPLDLFPDVIPLFGIADDVAIIPLLIAFGIRMIEKSIKDDARLKMK